MAETTFPQNAIAPTRHVHNWRSRLKVSEISQKWQLRGGGASPKEIFYKDEVNKKEEATAIIVKEKRIRP